MDFQVLGPVEIRAAGRSVDLGQPRQRAVLAALLVDVGRPVSFDLLVDRVWGQSPPRQARQALYVYIARIRKLIADVADADTAPVEVVRRAGGYALLAQPELVDVCRFRSLVERAHRPHCEVADRAALLAQALSLWTGPPLADISSEWAARFREQCERQRLDAAVAWGDAELRLGAAHVVIDPLADLLAEYPLAEPVAVALMRALRSRGRGVEALGYYAAMRSRLADELGIDPGADLQELHGAILRGDAKHPPSAPSVPPPPTAPSAPVPRQLPVATYGFAGREQELAALDALVAESTSGRAAVVISAVLGTPGIGKTALGVQWAHRVAGKFPDGQLYADLRGFDPTGHTLSAAEVVRGFLDGLGVLPQRVPASVDAQAALYRSLLADKRMLIMLDNALDAQQVRPLLPGTPGCLVIVTSRNELSGLVATEAARPITLGLLSVEEARALLGHRLGEHRLAAQPQAVNDIIARCARLPLALTIAAARAIARPNLRLSVLAEELREARTSLDGFGAQDPNTDVRAVFSWSYRTLDAGAARLFRLVGLHCGPEISTTAAAALAAVPPDAVRAFLRELTRAHLLTEHSPGRYTFHDLLRAYAAELAHDTDTDTERRQAITRVVDHYLHTAHAAAQLLHPHRQPITLPPVEPTVAVDDLTDHAHALAWLTTEHPVLLAATRQAADQGHDVRAWQLAATLSDFLDRRGHWHDWVAIHTTALYATHRLGDPAAEGHIHRSIARAYTKLSRYEDALSHLRRALDLYTESGDPAGQARTHRNLSQLAERCGRNGEALDHSQQAHELYGRIGNRAAQADALNAVGWCQSLVGNYHQGLIDCRAALTLLQRYGNRAGEAATWDSLGYAHHNLAQHREAIDCYQHALDLHREAGDRYNQALVLTHLGDAQHSVNHLADACLAWRQALNILDELEHPDADDLRAKLAQARLPTR